MSFNGNEGAEITLEEGAALTKRYRDSKVSTTKSLFVGRNHIEKIFAQDDCMGLRIYLGSDKDGNPEVVLVGADSNEEDQLDLIVDKTIRCPPSCNSSNPLNSDVTI